MSLFIATSSDACGVTVFVRGYFHNSSSDFNTPMLSTPFGFGFWEHCLKPQTRQSEYFKTRRWHIENAEKNLLRASKQSHRRTIDRIFQPKTMSRMGKKNA